MSDLPGPLFERTLVFLEELTAVSSASGDREGLARAANLLGRALAERGLAAEVRAEAGEGGAEQPVLVARGPGAAERYLLLIGHLDTVLPAAPPRREDGRLVATGAIDMKGGLATLVGALDLLAARGVAPPRDLLLVAVPDEEVGGPLSHRAVATWGAGARAFWVLEPGEPADGGETLVAGRRGMLVWNLRVEGRAAHSGLHYWEGRSALAAAARWCAAAEELSRPGPGPTINCGRLVAGTADFVGALGDQAALLGTERQLNVVPDLALAEGEARFLRAGQGDAILGHLRDLAERIAAATGTRIELREAGRIPPVDPHSPHRAWIDRAVELAQARGWRLEVEDERGGISFPNFLPDPGRIPVLDGLGPVGGGMHTRDEFVDLESLRRRVVLLADLLAADAGPQPG